MPTPAATTRCCRAAALLAAAVTLSACIQPPAEVNSVELFKSLGSRQCSGGGSTLEALTAPLRAAGVEVLNAACGDDGRMRIAMCGAADGRIAIVEIRTAQLAAAQAQGFNPLSDLPQASRTVDCR